MKLMKSLVVIFLLALTGNLMASGVAPRVSNRLVSQLIPRYGVMTLGSGVYSTSPMSYQWFFNGEAIPLATSTNLNLTDLEFADTGSYSVVATNELGGVTNGPALLTVSEALVLGSGITFSTVSSNFLNIPSNATNLARISAGVHQVLALRADGSPVGWGSSPGLATFPASATNLSKVFAGETHSMALNQEGQLILWNATNNQVAVPSRAVPALHASVGGLFAGSVTEEGKLALWRLTNANMVVKVPESTAKAARVVIRRESSIEDNVLVLRRDGAIVGWRQDRTNSNVIYYNPAILTKITNACAFDFYGFTGLSMAHRGIALRGNGKVLWWSQNSSVSEVVPANVSNIVAVAASLNNGFVALRNDGQIFYWGGTSYFLPPADNQFSALAVGSDNNKPFIAAIASDGTPRFVDQLGDLTANRGSDFSLNALVVGKPPLSYQWQFNGEDIVGATDLILTIRNIQDEASGLYTVTVSNAMGTVSGEVANLSVETPFTAPSIIQQPESVVIDAGSPASFSVAATGWPLPYYQWQSNNVNIVGATNATYTIPLAHTNHIANYRVVVSNFEGSVTSEVATLAVEVTPRPAFVSWPTDQSASIGQNRNLGVVVTGSEPITYQWQRNGVNIPNANGPNLFLNQLSSLEHGVYRVVISNEFGVSTSPEFRMDVAPLIAWGRNAKGQTNLPPDLLDTVAVAAGNQHALALQADGTVVAWGDNEFGQTAVPSDLTNAVAIAAGYRFSLALRSDGTVVGWGANDAGQIDISLTATNVISIDAGYAFGYALRADGTVVVWGANNHGQQQIPESARDIVAIKAGWDHLLALRADGKIITWGNLPNGLGNVPPTATNVVALAAGANYSMAIRQWPATQVSWPSGYFSSSPVFLRFELSPQYSMLRPLAMAGTVDRTLVVTDYRGFMMYASGSGINDPRIVRPENLGPSAQLAVSWEFNLLLMEAAGPIVTPQVASRVAYEGGTAVFNALGHGEVQGDYQWRFNGENLPGQTNVHLVLKNVQQAQAGEYSFIKSHGGGSSTGAVTRLEVVLPALPEIATHPASQSLPVGTNVTFNALLKAGFVGWPQWQFNGEDIPGATNRTLVIPRVQPGHEGEYQVIFTNVTGSVTSLVATLTLTPTAPYIVSQPQDVAVIAGGMAFFQVEALGSLPLAYQWRFNGLDIPEANTSTLFLTNIQPANVGHYTVVVTNDLGTVTSADAKLVLTPAFGVGNNTYGQLDLPIGASNLVSLAAGSAYVLGLRADGQVLAWGNNDCNRVTIPAGVSNIVRIAAGEIHSLALRSDGRVFGWGGVTPPGDLHNIVEIAAGAAHGLALQADGTIRAWGKYNNVGQTNVPVGLTNVVAISAGAHHGLALKKDGSLTAWGALGGVPGAATNIVRIASGFAYNVALRGDGQLVAWGYLAPTNVYTSTVTCNSASLNTPAIPADRLIEVPSAATNIVSIAAGRHHIVALRADGAVITWGANDSGQLDLLQGDNVFAVAAGGNMSFTLQGDLSPRLGYWANERSVGDTRPIALTSVAAGRLPIAYQWQFAGQDIPGATNGLYYLPEARMENVGGYTLIVTNINGNAQATVSLIVTSHPPVFVSHPVTNQLVLVGDTVTFSAEVKGTMPMTYRWQYHGYDLVNGPNISGADTPTLTLSNVTAQNDGWYVLRAFNSAGWAESSKGVLHVLAREPLVEALDADGLVWRTGGPGGWHWQKSVTHDGVDAAETGPYLTAQTNWIETTVTGPVTVFFWWKFDGWLGDEVSFAVDGNKVLATSFDFNWGQYSYELPAGEHTLRWTLDAEPFGGASTFWLDEVTFGESVPVTIVTQPSSRSAGAGANTTFSVGATGTMPYLYQWQYGETNLFGATNATLTLSNLQMSDAGSYRVIVSNSQGEVPSQPASLTVTSSIPGVRIVGNSPYTNIFSAALGTDTMLSAVVTGQTPFSLQWQFERQNLPGQTGNTLIISNVQPDKVGMYRVAVSNQFGLSYSAEVELDLVPVAAWGLNDQLQLHVPYYIDLPYGVMQVGAADDFSVVAQTNGPIDFWGATRLPIYSWTELESFALGGGHLVALRTNGAIYSYGLPMTAPVLSNVVAVAAGAHHQLALHADGSVVAWGGNDGDQSSPPADATNLVAIAGGELFSLGLRADGTVMGWGTNDHGQLDFPAILTNVAAISAGYQHGVALRDNGTVVTWGTDTNQTVPDGISNIVAVAAGQYHNLALKRDGTVVTWGSTIPELNYIWPTLTNVIGLAGGRAHSLALIGDGSPRITVQPWLRVTSETGQPKLQVMAVGGGELSYQWQHNDEDVAGATAATLFLNATNLPGNYRVAVSNTLGTVTSREVAFGGMPPVLVFEAIGMEADGLHLRLSGFSGQRPIVIYSSTDLVNWQSVLTNAPTTGTIEFVDGDVSAAARFYQAVEE